MSDSHSVKSGKVDKALKSGSKNYKSNSTFSKNYTNTISSKKNNSSNNQTQLDSFINEGRLSESGNSYFEYAVNPSYIAGKENQHQNHHLRILQILEMKSIFYSISILHKGKVQDSLNVGYLLLVVTPADASSS